MSESPCSKIEPDPTSKKVWLSIFVILAAGSVGALIGKAVWEIPVVGPWLAVPFGLLLPVVTLYTVWTSYHAVCPSCGSEFSLSPKQNALMCVECKAQLTVNGPAMEVCLRPDTGG